MGFLSPVDFVLCRPPHVVFTVSQAVPREQCIPTAMISLGILLQIIRYVARKIQQQSPAASSEEVARRPGCKKFSSRWRFLCGLAGGGGEKRDLHATRKNAA